MSEGLRVEFKVAVARRPEPKPRPVPGAKEERQRQDRAARKVRQLALAHHISEMIESGQASDLAAVARLCGVSRARVSQVVGLLSIPGVKQGQMLGDDLWREQSPTALLP